MTRKVLIRALGVAAALAALTPLAASAQNRFHGLDRNKDGVVTRAEWRGNDQSFRNQDRNHDGVLSGVELRGIPSVRSDDRDKDKDKDKPAKVKPKTPAKAKPAKPAKHGRGRGHGGNG